MDRGASLAIVHGINKSWTWLSDWITTTNWYVISTSITKHRYYQFVVAVKSLSCVQHFVTPWTVACQASLSFTISWICSSSCPLSWWYHPTISSSVVPFSSCLQSFSATGSFPMSQFLTSGGQSIGVSTSPSLLPINIQDWFPLGLTDLISLQSKGLLRVFSNTTVQKHLFFSAQLSSQSSSHIHTWPLFSIAPRVQSQKRHNDLWCF